MSYEEWKSVHEHGNPFLDVTPDNDVSLKWIRSQDYRNAFDSITDNEAVNESIYQSAVEILTHRKGTNGEDLYLIDGNTGKIVYSHTRSAKANGVVYTPEMIDAIQDALKKNIPLISLHNHPNNTPPSLDDGVSALRHGYSKGVVVTHDGKSIYTYGKANEIYAEDDIVKVHNKIFELITTSKDKSVDELLEIWYNKLNELASIEVKRIVLDF